MKFRSIWEGRWILAILAACTVAAAVFFPLFAILLGGLLIFSLNFFRDPERTPPADPSLAVSPADGKVVAIEEVEEVEFLKTRVKRVVIFLSVFDVHINRAPWGGEITHSVPKTGLFLDARDPESSRLNERRTWVFRSTEATIVVRQITGAIARRICPWKNVGDRVERGDRFGMIRFGSRTEVDFPLSSEILVGVGDAVLGGATPVARLTLAS